MWTGGALGPRPSEGSWPWQVHALALARALALAFALALWLWSWSGPGAGPGFGPGLAMALALALALVLVWPWLWPWANWMSPQWDGQPRTPFISIEAALHIGTNRPQLSMPQIRYPWARNIGHRHDAPKAPLCGPCG